MKTRIARPIFASLIALVALGTMGARGCDAWADVDRKSYEIGVEGQTTLYNDSKHTLFLPGCSQFGLEQRVGESWIDRGPFLQCVWEGIGIPLEAGEFFASTFVVPNQMSTWRLVYKVSWGCQESLPLSAAHCSGHQTLYTSEFEVVAQTEPRCSDLGEIDFGMCKMFLGWAVLGGSCKSVSGCDSKGFAFFRSQQECQGRC